MRRIKRQSYLHGVCWHLVIAKIPIYFQFYYCHCLLSPYTTFRLFLSWFNPCRLILFLVLFLIFFLWFILYLCSLLFCIWLTLRYLLKVILFYLINISCCLIKYMLRSSVFFLYNFTKTNNYVTINIFYSDIIKNQNQLLL